MLVLMQLLMKSKMYHTLFPFNFFVTKAKCADFIDSLGKILYKKPKCKKLHKEKNVAKRL